VTPAQSRGDRLSVFGTVQYVNLGHTSSSVALQGLSASTLNRDARPSGAAFFAVGHVPLPISNVDFDVKIGLSRLNDSQSQSLTPIPIDSCVELPLPPNAGCAFRVHRTNTISPGAPACKCRCRE
jgi:hypothetical protein